jgi:predicted RNA-binding protein YlxR (DUF448 family)
MGGSMHTIKKNEEALIVARKEGRLEVNADTTKYMVTIRDQNSGRSHYINIDKKKKKKVEELKKKLVTTSKDQNSIQEEIKSRMKSQNACYHSEQNLLSFSLLFNSI